MKNRDILKTKGSAVHSIEPTATLADVVYKLVACNVGSLIVMSGEEVQGIITERDILRACASETRRLREIPVTEKMTKDLISCTSEEAVNASMGIMTDNRIRHLPIVDEGKLVGIISIGDLVKAQHDSVTLENQFLKNYIQG